MRRSKTPEGTLATSPPGRRALFVDDRGGALRVTWYEARGLVVLSFWRQDVCVGTCRLSLEDAARLCQLLADQRVSTGE
ncbi:MAG: hypothetical protein ACRDZ4_05680 [Egibacteraceae bacterium]